jgi:hypothetical protein
LVEEREVDTRHETISAASSYGVQRMPKTGRNLHEIRGELVGEVRVNGRCSRRPRQTRNQMVERIAELEYRQVPSPVVSHGPIADII